MNRKPIHAMFVVASLVSGGAFAQSTQPMQSTPATQSARPAAMAKLDRADAAFLKNADHAGRTEIEASGMAQERATSENVKTFAKQMSTDHAKAGDELKALAMSKGVELPGEPSLRQKAKIKLLGTMKGDRFDKQYADEVGVGAHEETVKLFREAAANAKDADVKAFASKTLPTLEHHLGMARELKQTVAAKTATSASTSAAK